jgi:hypothetical protein
MDKENLILKYDYDINIKLDNFEKYVRGQRLTRFLARYELFKEVLDSHGSIIECGVHYGGGLLAWAKISSALEPFAFDRKIIGFDSFEGFPSISKKNYNNKKNNDQLKEGGFYTNESIYAEMLDAVDNYENNKPLNSYNKIELIKGDARRTIPEYIKNNSHLIIALLYLDFDLYEPTLAALENFLPRMPRGAIIAFDELNDQRWVGETTAYLEKIKIKKYRLNKMRLFPSLSFIKL